MTGRLFDIQHFCTHDGPGIRTTLFLKGCPLRCAWCHNPESQGVDDELFFHASRCIACGACDVTCPHTQVHLTLAKEALRKERCRSCLRCADVCVTGAIERVGRDMTVEQVMEEVRNDEPYFRHSRGGVTLSGGEPMMQPRFTAAVLRALRDEGIHTALETSGQGKMSDFLDVVPFVNLFLWDVKFLDEIRYKTYTGQSLSVMLRNLRAVYHAGGQLVLRVIFVPELHDNESYVDSLAALIHELGGVAVEYIPYHNMGNAKRAKLGLTQDDVSFSQPTPEQMRCFETRVTQLTGK